MIPRRSMVLTTWAAAALTVGLAGWQWLDPIPSQPGGERSILTSLSAAAQAAPTGRPDSTHRLVAIAAQVRDRNPFRIDRRPSLVAFGVGQSAGDGPGEAEVAVNRHLPGLRLAGVVGGPPWNALFLGIPGKESGVVLEVGAEWNGFRFEAFRNDTVFLAGLDTTWVLIPGGNR